VPHRKLKSLKKDEGRLNKLITEYLPGSGPTDDTEHLFCTFIAAIVKAINKVKPFCVHKAKGPARLKIHNDVRSLGQILRCLQLDVPIPQSLKNLPVCTKIKSPTASTVKRRYANSSTC
jgi:hypothetical protein